MDIFSYEDYRTYLQDHVDTMEGVTKKKVSSIIKISPSLFSQILNRDRNLSSDQAYRFAIHMGFHDSETSYWLLLLDYANAGTEDLRMFIKKKINEFRREIQNNPRIRQGHTKTNWSQEFVSVFYSSWHFSAVYCVLVTEKTWSVDLLSKRIGLSSDRTQQILDFFEHHQIVEQAKGSRYKLTHVGFVNIAGKDQPAHKAAVFHNTKNFRRKAMDVLEENQFNANNETVFQTITALISKDDYAALKNEIQELVNRFYNKVSKENFEVVTCLNIDCFQL